MAPNGNNIAGVIIGVLPQLMQFISGFHAASDRIPTLAEVQAKFNVDADEVIAKSDAWLAAHPVK